MKSDDRHYIPGETVARWFYDKYVMPKEGRKSEPDTEARGHPEGTRKPEGGMVRTMRV